MATVSRRFRIAGRVQGVGFRFATQREALKLGISGYARNLHDGTVEVLAVGPEEHVDRLLAWLSSGGPRGATVEGVTTESQDPDTSVTGFSTY